MTVSEAHRLIVDTLSAVKDTREATACADLLTEHFTGLDKLGRIMNPEREIMPETMRSMHDALTRLLHHEPVQYIMSKAHFHGLELNVTPAVLIPRPETSQLVDIIEKDYKGRRDLKIMDICTGSGCIAIALARDLPFSHISAVDISEAALRVARRNITKFKVDVTLIQSDALTLPPPPEPMCDIIVSNPPYVTESERAEMEPDVLNYEPPLALFVPNNDPLCFYRSIASYGQAALYPKGRIYFEINPSQDRAIRQCLRQAGWNDIDSIRDIHGRCRFVTAVCP